MSTRAILCAACAFQVAPLHAAVNVPTGSLPELRQPQVAVTNDGRTHLVFGSEDRIYVTTASGALRFGDPVLVARLDGLMLGMRRGPRIAIARDAIVVTAIGADGNLVSWQSSTGEQWTGPIVVNDVGKSAREGLHHLSADDDGNLFAVWLDLRNGSTEVFGARSTNGAQTWETNSLVYRSPSGTVCECCQPAATFGGRGQLFVMWRNALDGNRDLYFAASSDSGRSFSSARKLGAASWQLNACPMDGGFLTADRNERVTTVWRRGTEVFTAEGQSGRERSLGKGEQPWIASGRDGNWIAWVSGRPGNLWLLRPGGNEPERFASGAADPVIASAAGGGGPVVMAWEVRQNGRTRIQAALLEAMDKAAPK